MKKNLHIFNSNLNEKFKLIPLKTKFNDSGKTKYLPPVSKEWKNTVYSYYANNMQNMPVNNLNANKIIKAYFNLYFKDKFLPFKSSSDKKQHGFIRKLYISSLETKHMNSKIIMTLYTYNLEKSRLQNTYTKNLLFFNKRILKFWKKKLKNKIKVFMKQDIEKKNLVFNEFKKTENTKNLYIYKYKLLCESMKWYNLYIKLYLSKIIKNFYNEKLKYLRKYELNYKLNKYKFENFLPKLSAIFSKLYNNNIEFNIVNLKSLTLNTEMLTEYLSLKLRKRNARLNSEMKNLLKKVNMPQVNHIVEKSKRLNYKDLSLVENKYKNLNLLSIMQETNTNNLNKLLQQITTYTSEKNTDKDYENISDLIFKSIKYKNLGGVRLEVKGRLSKRNRADRSQFKLKWKGGLKDIDSSYKTLSTTMYRGLQKPNILYSLSSSKRSVGAFAVKGWISGK
jgi:hypothetical protein